MAEYSSSFNATGQTFVAFECVDTGPRGFGAGVNGSQVGVHGEGMQNPLGSRAVSVQYVGVHGRGDHYGVYGIGGGIAPDSAPDFSPPPVVQPTPENPVGVMGVSPPGSPAVIGDCNVLQSDLTEDTRGAVANLNAGVVGLSQGATEPKLVHGELQLVSGVGVVGLGQFTALDAATINYALDPYQVRGDAPYAGVAGLSGLGAGVYGFSTVGRGGTFASNAAAQISLVPRLVSITDQAPVTVPATSLPTLPGYGQAGDMIAVAISSRAEGGIPIFSLWFCFQSYNPDSNEVAQWAEVTLGRGIPGVTP